MLAQLRQDIVNNVFVPEEKLKFSGLTKKYDLGIGTLREALSHLVSEGFVTLETGRGFRVAPISKANLIEITDFHVSFECRALREAIEKGDDEWEAQIVASYHRLNLIHDLPREDRIKRHDEWIDRHSAFHDALLATCTSEWLMRLRSLMFFQTERYRFLSKTSVDRAARKKAEHRAIMEATLARDDKTAAELLEQHLRETAQVVLNSGQLAD